MINYNNRHFRAVTNTNNGEATGETRFHYQQSGTLLTGTYSGGRIEAGQLLGTVGDDGQLDFYYQHRNTDGQLMAGLCHAKPEQLPNGKLRMHESWQWFTGDGSAGTSVVEEI
jgi:hypothetical protein